jgi:hypothetical protein
MEVGSGQGVFCPAAKAMSEALRIIDVRRIGSLPISSRSALARSAWALWRLGSVRYVGERARFESSITASIDGTMIEAQKTREQAIGRLPRRTDHQNSRSRRCLGNPVDLKLTPGQIHDLI